jgi:tetratricopeptide (TPR) repeat protein
MYILFSCIAAKPLIIEIPQKSKKELPDRIQSLLLIARVVDDSYTNLKADSLQRLFYNQKFNYDTIIKDIQSVDTTLKALGELLFESGRYDFVIPENRFPEFEKNAFMTSEMPWDEVKLLSETYQTDAVLSIDYFKTRVITTYDKESYFSPAANQFYNMSEATMKISYETLIRIYDPSVEKVLTRMLLRDTLFWKDRDYSAAGLFEHFTPVKKALNEVGIAIALDFSGEIGPLWLRERRSFFATGSSALKQAAPLVNAGQWEPAIALWKDTAEKTKSKSVKSKTEYNIALGYEMQGDLDAAIEWALKSYNTMYRTNTYNYLETLKRRKNEIKNQ